MKPVSEAERAAVEEKHKTWKKHECNRRRIFKELWYRCVDLLPEGQSKEELWVGTNLDKILRTRELTGGRTSLVAKEWEYHEAKQSGVHPVKAEGSGRVPEKIFDIWMWLECFPTRQFASG